LRQFALPIDRVTRVVDVSDDSRQLQEVVGLSDPSSTENRKPKTDTYSPEIRVTLTDNPILIFEPLEVKKGKLLGRSSIYDKVSVPVDSIQYLHFGEKAKSFKSVYEEWVVRPAQEPAYEDKSSPSQNPRIRNR